MLEGLDFPAGTILECPGKGNHRWHKGMELGGKPILWLS